MAARPRRPGRVVVIAAILAEELVLWRRGIVARFARLRASGKPVFCTPSQAELSGRVPRVTKWGNDGKVIFDSFEQAEACARALEATGCRRQVPYQCQRGTRGHHHLTHDGKAAPRRGRS